MRQLWQQYKFVRLINELVKEYESENPEIKHTRHYFHPVVDEVVRKFAKENGMSYHDALNTSSACLDSKFVLTDRREINHEIHNIFCIQPKGYKLLEHWWKYPHGFINEGLKEMGPTLTFVSALVASGVFYFLWHLLTGFWE